MAHIQNHKSKAAREAEISQIRRYLYAGLSNSQIINQLKIPERTFYDYMKKIAEQDLKIQREQGRDYIALHLNKAREGMANLKRAAYRTLDDPEATHRERIDACRFLAELELTIVKLEHEGTTLMQVIPNDGKHRQLVQIRNLLSEQNPVGSTECQRC
jgi:hypothetical protein